MSKVLSKAFLKQGGDKPYRKVELEQFQIDGEVGAVLYRPLSAKEVINITERQADMTDSEKFGLMLDMIADRVVDELGAPMFVREEVDDLPIDVVMAISGAITGTSEKAQKEIEEVKNA